EFSRQGKRLEKIAELMASSGMVEAISYELVDESSFYKKFERSAEEKVEVSDPRSIDHSILRDSLLRSLLSILSRNIKEDYPQRIFEVGRVYHRVGKKVEERWSLAAMIAHSQASFSEARCTWNPSSGHWPTSKSLPHLQSTGPSPTDAA